jgi:hypothetical protein
MKQFLHKADSIRNVTELAAVVTNAAYYLGTVLKLWPTSPTGTTTVNNILEDNPGCGLRNNDTFNLALLGPPFNFSNFGGEATADWSVECLWDCTWKDNPYADTIYYFTDVKNPRVPFNIRISMPKVPVDLRCLDGCTDVQPPTLIDFQTFQPFDCSNYPGGSFLSCYINYALLYGDDIFLSNDVVFLSKSYFHLAVESCTLAILEPSLYPEGNCDQQRVNLRVFNPLLDPPFFSSLPSTTKLQGPGTEGVLGFSGIFGLRAPVKNRYPWLCSLRTTGYKSPHRCGVTLLSAPPKPTIFASAAHCNYICKDETNQVVDICCCRDPLSESSCSNSTFCGTTNSLQLANPQDLQIVCNITGQADTSSTRIRIREIRNHPNYKPLSKESINSGPIGGFDISVYIVDDIKFSAQLNPDYVWPACLPKSEESYLAGNRGILAGWNEPRPTQWISGLSLQEYINQDLIVNEALFERQPACSDPTWMRSNTYYPAGTVCYTEAAWAASIQFGLSGSGLVRPFISTTGTTHFSWIGPLSLSKGSDRSLISNSGNLIGYSSNPAVFTDAFCYLDWIAAQYGLSLPASYIKPSSCNIASGDKLAVNNANCLSRAFLFFDTTDTDQDKKCQFTPEFKKCQEYYNFIKYLPQQLQYRSNFYYCNNALGNPRLCANDCPGVDPNAVVVGGEAALFTLAAATSLAAPSLLEPALGAVAVAAGLGLGQFVMNRNRTLTPAGCPVGECRLQGSNRCCKLVPLRGRNLCPLAC